MRQHGLVEDWRIHIGAHKTATTHLQDTLALMKPDLAEQGIDYLRRGDFRRKTRVILSARSPARLLGGQALGLAVGWQLQRLCCGGPRLVVSEENLLGSNAGLMAPTLYTGMERRVSALNALARRARLTLFLSIRSFDRVMPGGYVTALRFNPRYVGILAAVRDRVERQPSSWLPLIDRVAASAPDARVRLWRHEDYSCHAAEITSRFLGTEEMPVPDLSAPTPMRTPSCAAVKAVEAEARLADPATRTSAWYARAQEILARFKDESDPEPFRPFPDRLVGLMQERYAEGCEEIRTRWGDAFIRPAGT